MAIIPQKWTTPSSLATVISTDMNDLGINSVSAVPSAALDNSAALLVYGQLELTLASITPGVDPADIAVHMKVSVDGGTTYSDAGGHADTVDMLRVTQGASAKYVVSPGIIQLPPGHIKFQVTNRTGVALASSGNTLKIRTFTTASETA
jgi:hypothetical protein